MSIIDLNTVPDILLLDFDGVFTDNFVEVNSQGLEVMRFSKYDSYGISLLTKAGLKVHVISSDINGDIISQRCNKMNISFSFGVKDKVSEAIRVCSTSSGQIEKCAFLGNDLNDLELLDAVGTPIIVNDAHASLFNRGYIRTSCNGGNGAIREVADRILSLLESSHEG